MANDTRQRLGEMVQVENSVRRFGSANDYWVIYIEEPDGEVVPLMLTWGEFKKLRDRAVKNPEDIPEYRKRFTQRFRR